MRWLQPFYREGCGVVEWILTYDGFLVIVNPLGGKSSEDTECYHC